MKKNYFKTIKVGSLTLMLALGAFVSSFAQDNDKVSMTLSLNADSFFGLNPMASGAYNFSDNTAFTFYGIQWGAGTGAGWGQWTEFGVGISQQIGDLNINPMIGFTKGSLLSSGAGERGIIGDGIVPNLTANYNNDKLEGQIYAGYYAPLRNNTTAGLSTNSYVHYWANLGYKAASWFSFGVHYENLYLSGGQTFNEVALDRVDGYIGLGPYVQFTKGSSGMRLSLGGNLADEDTRFAPNDFYKMSFFVGL